MEESAASLVPLSQKALKVPRFVAGSLLENCEVFDLYQGGAILPSKKSIAYSLLTSHHINLTLLE